MSIGSLKERKNEINKEKVRRLTPMEYGRLQGFPEGFKMPISNKQKYYMFGNSVAVPVIAAIFAEIKKKFCNNNERLLYTPLKQFFIYRKNFTVPRREIRKHIFRNIHVIFKTILRSH